MDNTKGIVPLPANAAAMPTKNLLKNLVADVTELVKTEVTLAKTELRRDLKAEMTTAKGLGAAALLGYMGIILLFVTIILALGNVMPTWAAGLLVSGLVLAAAAISGALGWAKRVRTPLSHTRHELKATLAMAKERTT
jgi:uncharacterized membrane protein YqjE